MSMCDTCASKLKPWAESLRAEFSGCNLLLLETNEGRSIEELAQGIKAEVVGEGWVSNGIMAFNFQILTKNVSSCLHYRPEARC